jgi:hypothetical protein
VLDTWHIFACCKPDGSIYGSVFLFTQARNAEVFGMAFETAEDAEKAAFPLLSHALQSVFSEVQTAETVAFFVEESDAELLTAASKAGFSLRSHYRCMEAML